MTGHKSRADRLLAIIGDLEGDVYQCGQVWYYQPSDGHGDRALGSTFDVAEIQARKIRREAGHTIVRSPLETLQTTLLEEGK